METMTINRPAIEQVREKSKVRKLISQAPIICGCKNGERLSVMFGAAYDKEYEGGTALDCTPFDLQNPGKRLQIVNPLNYEPENIRLAEIVSARLTIAEFSTYKEKGRITGAEFDDIIYRFSDTASQAAPEIDAILTYEEATTLAYWWF